MVNYVLLWLCIFFSKLIKCGDWIISMYSIIIVFIIWLSFGGKLESKILVFIFWIISVFIIESSRLKCLFISEVLLMIIVRMVFSLSYSLVLLVFVLWMFVVMMILVIVVQMLFRIQVSIIMMWVLMLVFFVVWMLIFIVLINMFSVVLWVNSQNSSSVVVVMIIGVGNSRNDLLLSYVRVGELKVMICLVVINCVILCLVIIRISVVIKGWILRIVMRMLFYNLVSVFVVSVVNSIIGRLCLVMVIEVVVVLVIVIIVFIDRLMLLVVIISVMLIVSSVIGVVWLRILIGLLNRWLFWSII